MTINISLPNDLPDLRPRISVIGVGGAGGNAVNNMIRANLEGVEFIATNTDSQALQQSLADRRIQLGRTVTQGLGAGSRPAVGRAAAEEEIDQILSELGDSNMVFITAGMGGGTGSGAAPVIAQAAGERDILTVGVVTKPFHFEGAHRMRTAEAAIEELTQYVDTLIIIPNQNLFRIANEKTTFADAFNMADDVLHSGVRGVTDLMVMPGMINLDFADIRTVMSEMGKAMMGTGEAEGENRAREAAEAAINNPLLDDTSMKGAKGMLINITGGYDMTLFEVDEAANRIREEVDSDANIIFGSTFDEKMSGSMRVSVVATGIAAEGMMVRPPRAAMTMINRPASKMIEAPSEAEAEEISTVVTPEAAEIAAEAASIKELEEAILASEDVAPEQLVIPETVEDASEQAAVAAEVEQSAGTLVASAPEPKTAAEIERERVKDAFMPQAPATPRVARAGAPTSQPGAFEAAEMANAGRAPVQPMAQPQAQTPVPAQSLLQKVTGLTKRYRDADPVETTAPAATSPVAAPIAAQVATPIAAPAATPAPAATATPSLTEVAPQADQAPAAKQRLGALDRSDRLTPTQASDDLLDIPAFLRRQAS